MKKKVISLVLAGAMVLGLTACGGYNQTASTANTAAASGSTTSGAAAASDTKVAAHLLTSYTQQDTEADSVTVGISEDPQSLMPFGGPKDALFCYETLGTRDTFAGNFVGVLMKDWKQVDDTTFDVTLYDYIYDQDGNHLTASDVAFSWNKAKEIAQLSEISVVDSITALDDYTVEFKWASTPTLGSFESMMSDVYIVTEAAYNASADGMATSPVGTSPYKVTNYVSSSSITLEDTGNYWQTDPSLCKAACQIHNVKTINMQIISESSQMTNALASGTIDFSSAVETADLPQFQAGGQYSSTYTVETVENGAGYALIPNVSESSPLHDENLRKAVYLAIDTASMETALLGDQGKVNYVFGDDRYPDYESKWEETYYGYDLDQAKEYLAKSEYPDGCTLNLNLSSGLQLKDNMAEMIQAFLLNLNITVNINSMPIGQYLTAESDPTQWDLELANFSAPDYLINVWTKLFDANATGTGMTKNFAKDDELQTAIDVAASIDGHNDESMDAVYQILNDKGYCYGLIQPYSSVVYNTSKITGYVFDMNIRVAPGAFTYNV